MSIRAGFFVEEETPERVVLRDAGQGCTITNDAEAVVALLLKEGRIVPGRTRLLYYDTDGQLDELLFDKRGFVGFQPWEGDTDV